MIGSMKTHMIRNTTLLCLTLSLLASTNLAPAQNSNTPAARPARPTPPTRDPHTAGYVEAKELPDGTVPPLAAEGNFIIGPTHDRAPEMSAHTNVPAGKIYELTMHSEDSKIFPGIAREPNTSGKPDPADPAKLVVTTSHPAPYTRHVAVYVPAGYVAGTVAPFIIGADGPDRGLFTALDNLIAQKRVPAMVTSPFTDRPTALPLMK